MNRCFRILMSCLGWILLNFCPKQVLAQDYYNSISVKGGWVQPLGQYQSTTNSYDHISKGLQAGYSLGIEWKTKMLVFDLLQEEISNAFFSNSGGQSPFGLVIALEKNRFEMKRNQPTIGSTLAYDQITGSTMVDVNKLNLGLFYTLETESEEFFTMIKISGGVGQLILPEMNYLLSDLPQYKQEKMVANTSNLMGGVDFVYDLGKVRIQLQYEITWMRPEIRTTIHNYVNGGYFYKSTDETFWSHGVNLTVGLNFSE